MRYLLDRGGDPAMPTDRGSTPLHDAAENGHCEPVILLLSKGVHVDAIDYRGTPLHLAAAKDRDQVVKILLEHGADPNRIVNHIFSPLMMACCGHSLKCMRLLIEAGADVNGHGYSGPTPLTEAVDDGLTDFVKLLLDARADPNIPNQHGEIPIKLAAARDQRELVEILFPRTKLIPSLPDWSVDGIIRTVKSPHLKPQVMEIDPLDTTMLANRSLCWLQMQEGDRALLDARQCKMMQPGWSKAWYCEGADLSLLKDYKGAAGASLEALKLDPASNEIMEALREAIESMNDATR